MSSKEKALSSTGCATPTKAAYIYPKDSPGRPLHLAVRGLGVIFSIALITIVAVAGATYKRYNWLSPVLTPACSAFFEHCVDLLLVLLKDMRQHRLQRLFYDGALSVGFAIAGGFFVSITMGDLQGTLSDSTDATAAMARAILFFLFSEM
jgi:hypothetical protein